MMRRVPILLDPVEVEELRRSYGDLVYALARQWNYRPADVLDLGRDLIELTGSIEMATLAQDIEGILGVKANAALERLIRTAAERGVEFDQLFATLQRHRDETG